MRGEKDGGAWLIWQGAGSPPHARGKVPPPPPEGKATRITPACAGKSAGLLWCSSMNRDHPRMRGEKPQDFFDKLNAEGSPPHARGKGAEVLQITGTTGITPACAGKRKAGHDDAFIT